MNGQQTITAASAQRDDGVSLTLPAGVIRALGALLALAVAGVHVADQGGLTVFTSPDWLGWAYRLIEVGGLLVAALLLWPRSGRLAWAAATVLATGPFVGYLASRTVGVPGDAGDVGNWNDWVGTLSLVIEVAVITLSVAVAVGPWPPRRASWAAGPDVTRAPIPQCHD
jgi:hypothetical protein